MSQAQRIMLVAMIALLGIAVVFTFVPPVGQPLEYHNFADRRGAWGIPNFSDVMSNLAFGAAGVYGLWVLRQCKNLGARGADARLPLAVMFVGVMMVAPGSAYYHWAPDNSALFWDRLPITVAFMGLLAAVITDRIDTSFGVRLVLPLLVVVGAGSAVYWHLTDDLRAYGLVQILPLLMIPIILWLWPQGKWITWKAMGWMFLAYSLAKLCEHFDVEVLEMMGGVVSGHTLKHIFAALGPAVLAWTLRDQS